MRTSLPDVFAVGDAVALPHLVLGGPAWVPLGPAANKTGRVAGTVAAGGTASFAGVVGTAVVKVFDLEVARTGLGLAEATAAGLDAVATDLVSRSRAKYYPGSSPLHVRLVHAPGGRLLGGQLAGREGAAKRVDVLATALHAGLTVDGLAALDLSYAPPYAPVYDPVVAAAVKAAGSVPAAAGRQHRRRITMSLHPPRDKRASLADAVALVGDGAMVALGGGLCARLPMALVRELIRQGRRGLHLIGSAHSIDVDLLVAAGAVRRCEESYVGLRAGPRPGPGLPPGRRGRARSRWRRAAAPRSWPSCGPRRWGCRSCRCAGCAGPTSPRCTPSTRRSPARSPARRLVAVPALRPDVALLHAPAGDRYGNLHLEQPYVLDERFASASRMVVATVDELVSTEEVAAAGVTIPGHLVAAVAEVPFGAHPSSCYPRYAYDREHLREYVSAAQAGPADLDKYLATYVHGRRGGLPGGGRRRPARRAGRAGRSPPPPGRSCSDELDDRRVVRDRAGQDHPPGRDRVPRVRQPVRPGRDARGQAHPRAGHAAGRGRDVRDQPRPAVHPADQQRRQPQAAAPRTACGSRSSSTPRSAATWTGCSCPAGRSTATATPTSPRSARPGRPKVKLGGGGGGCNLSATIGQLTVWTTRHRSGRTLVAGCDFITDMGHRTPLGTRAELGFTGGGPQWLVTELGVFDFPTGRRGWCRSSPTSAWPRSGGDRVPAPGRRRPARRSGRRRRPNWPRSGRSTRSGYASPSSPPVSWRGRSEPGLMTLKPRIAQC